MVGEVQSWSMRSDSLASCSIVVAAVAVLIGFIFSNDDGWSGRWGEGLVIRSTTHIAISPGYYSTFRIELHLDLERLCVCCGDSGRHSVF